MREKGEERGKREEDTSYNVHIPLRKNFVFPPMQLELIKNRPSFRSLLSVFPLSSPSPPPPPPPLPTPPSHPPSSSVSNICIEYLYRDIISATTADFGLILFGSICTHPSLSIPLSLSAPSPSLQHLPASSYCDSISSPSCSFPFPLYMKLYYVLIFIIIIICTFSAFVLVFIPSTLSLSLYQSSFHPLPLPLPLPLPVKENEENQYYLIAIVEVRIVLIRTHLFHLFSSSLLHLSHHSSKYPWKCILITREEVKMAIESSEDEWAVQLLSLPLLIYSPNRMNKRDNFTVYDYNAYIGSKEFWEDLPSSQTQSLLNIYNSTDYYQYSTSLISPYYMNKYALHPSYLWLFEMDARFCINSTKSIDYYIDQQYDYVGALWPNKQKNRIGNSGFSLWNRLRFHEFTHQPAFIPYNGRYVDEFYATHIDHRNVYNKTIPPFKYPDDDRIVYEFSIESIDRNLTPLSFFNFTPIGTHDPYGLPRQNIHNICPH